MKANGKCDAETRRRGDTAMRKRLTLRWRNSHDAAMDGLLHRRVAVSPRLRVAFALCLLPFAFLLSCTPNRVSTVSANATEGYCPVCKMSVKQDSQWTAEIYYNDGTKLMFESPGDMLAFYFAPEKYDASDKQKDRASIEKILVKDYQSKKQIEARQASLVYGSNVKSDMGPELIPFGTREMAEEFVAKNGGKAIAWDEVTLEQVRNLRK